MRVFKLVYFEWSPPWHLSVIVSDISPGNIYGTIFWHSILAFYLTFYSWHSIWHLFWHPLWHLYWHFLWHFFCYMFWILAKVLACYLWHSIWHSILAFHLASIHILFWHSIWHILRGSLWLRPGGEHFNAELAVEVRRGTHWSWACCPGPAGKTLI